MFSRIQHLGAEIHLIRDMMDPMYMGGLYDFLLTALEVRDRRALAQGFGHCHSHYCGDGLTHIHNLCAFMGGVLTEPLVLSLLKGAGGSPQCIPALGTPGP